MAARDGGARRGVGRRRSGFPPRFRFRGRRRRTSTRAASEAASRRWRLLAGGLAGLAMGAALAMWAPRGDGPGAPLPVVSLPALPAPGVVRPRALPPWRRYAVPFVDPGSRPVIAIVIDDAGMDRPRTARAIDLEAPLTLAFLPYAPELARQTRAARAAGHEIIVHVPMEPHSARADPGPAYLSTAQDEAELDARLTWDLGRFGRYVGISNHMGSRFTEDSRRMRWLMGRVRARGLLFLDSMTSGASVGWKAAAEAGVPFVRRDVFLDNEHDADEVRMRLAQLEEIARRNGSAVGIGHPHDATIDVLAAWLPDARRRGFVLAPISAVVQRRLQIAQGKIPEGRIAEGKIAEGKSGRR